MLSHLKEVASFSLKVILVLPFNLINILIEEIGEKLLSHLSRSDSLGFSAIKTERVDVRGAEFLSDLLSDVDLEALSHLWELLLHARVPMVLDRVVSAALEHFGDLRPLVAIVAVHQVEYPFLLLAPADLLNLRVKMIVPSLAALFANTSWEMLGDQGPFLRAIFVHQM